MTPFVHPREVKERSRRLAELSKRVSLERNKMWMGWEGRILVDEVGKKDSSWVGRNFFYKPVVVKTGQSLLGKFLVVRAVRVFPTYLEAEIV
ncbi:MAG: TRAM domain-containing protein, partial [Candidatus Bathyarchaeota archaeon]|nr:TRAM domain-containing protein [Candidatus Bathyarchaeota archaeon]